jgi:hypothetical protein
MAVRMLLAVAVTALCSLACAQEMVWEGFEGKNSWVMVEWRNSVRGKMEISLEQSTEGTRSLKVVMNREQKTYRDKIGISREGYLNLARADKVMMDVYCGSDDGLAVSIAFDMGDKGDYFESVKRPLKRGWNKDISFDLSAEDFKCEASDWKYDKAMPDRSNITKMHIVIYRPSNIISGETLYIDNIRIGQKKPV